MRNIPHTNSIQFNPAFFANNNEEVALATAFDTSDQKIEIPITKNRVLIVEDNPLNQKVARIFLEDMGYSTEIAANGQEALYLAATQHYDLILMDVGLPDIDGLEITQKIRANETSERIPIIACTANGNTYKDKCLAAGMDDFVLKPIMQDELKRVLSQFLIDKK